MRIADDTEAIGRRYRELFRPGSEQPSPPKPEPETKSAAETMCPCGRRRTTATSKSATKAMLALIFRIMVYRALDCGPGLYTESAGISA